MRFAGAILLSHAAAVTASYSHYVRLVLDRRVQDAGVDLGSLCRTHQDMGREAVVHVLKPLLPLAARTKLVNSLASECSIQGFGKASAAGRRARARKMVGGNHTRRAFRKELCSRSGCASRFGNRADKSRARLMAPLYLRGSLFGLEVTVVFLVRRVSHTQACGRSHNRVTTLLCACAVRSIYPRVAAAPSRRASPRTITCARCKSARSRPVWPAWGCGAAS